MLGHRVMAPSTPGNVSARLRVRACPPTRPRPGRDAPARLGGRCRTGRRALAHFPSGQFYAKGARTVIAALTHNLLRWTSVIGLPDHTIRAARTVRRRFLTLPGRLTRTARRWTLHLPARLPWR